MADGGIASGALLGAVLSSAQNKDPLQGALMGGLGSLAFGAFGADAVGVDQSLGAVGADGGRRLAADAADIVHGFGCSHFV